MAFVQNSPSVWQQHLPQLQENSHKYDRGVAMIFGAPSMTGASRLAAAACARMGAGLVKVVAPKGTGDVYRASLPAHIVVVDENTAGNVLEDIRVRGVLVGSGHTQNKRLVKLIQNSLAQPHIKTVVLDAGGLLAWAGAKAEPNDKIIATPHDGEFQKAFPELVAVQDRVERAQAAQKRLGGVMILKGVQSVVAGQGQAIVQNLDVPTLSTAGTGDVLAGMITGLAAQGMPLREASAASVWIHAQCALKFGKGLVASDLPDLIPFILKGMNL